MVDIHRKWSVDIGSFNLQWVNNGSGIWAVDALNIYDWVDSSLLEEGFSAQEFGPIGSVQEDGILFTKVSTLAALTDPGEWFYDGDDRKLWIMPSGYDEPSIHTITIGVIYGYSFNEFTPDSAPVPYEGRLLAVPSVSIASDPLFYGIMRYGGGTVELANNDGSLDTLAKDNELYGNPVRIFIGFADLDYSEYQQIYTGFIETFSVNKVSASISVADLRKQLSRPSRETRPSRTPAITVNDLIEVVYGIPFTEDFYDVTAYNAADIHSFAISFDSSIQLNDSAIRPLTDYIEQCLTAGFFVLWITGDGRYTASAVNYSATTAGTFLRKNDIMNDFEVVYDPSRVVSSVKVGHSPTWTTSETVYKTYRNTTHEASVFSAYKTYKEHAIDLPLISTSNTILWSDLFLQINSVVHGTSELTVPLKYCGTNIGDVVYAELERDNGGGMVGTTLSYITSKSWNLTGVPTITFGIRFL